MAVKRRNEVDGHHQSPVRSHDQVAAPLSTAHQSQSLQNPVTSTDDVIILNSSLLQEQCDY